MAVLDEVILPIPDDFTENMRCASIVIRSAETTAMLQFIPDTTSELSILLEEFDDMEGDAKELFVFKPASNMLSK